MHNKPQPPSHSCLAPKETRPAGAAEVERRASSLAFPRCSCVDGVTLARHRAEGWSKPLSHSAPWDLPFQSREALGNINAAKDKYPLCALVQLADGFASSLMEDTVKN